MTQINDLFDEQFYLANNSDVAIAVNQGIFANGLNHFIEVGQFEGRDPGPLFNTQFYLTNNPDVAGAVQGDQLTGIEHFVNFGDQEGRDPSDAFNTVFYLGRSPDVAAAVQRDQLTGIEHYIKFGQFEGRIPRPLFSQVVVFGDSLSDDGNGFVITGGQLPPSPPYAQGRFTNGPVWIEQMTPRLGVPVNPDLNVALGGATTGTLNVNTELLPEGSPPLPGLQNQIDSVLSAVPNLDPHALYVVWAGANNYLGGDSIDVQGAITELGTAITKLTEAGARNILMGNLPNISLTPSVLAQPPEVQQGLALLQTTHNQALSVLESTLDANPNINIILVDFSRTFDTLRNNPTNFGFTNITDPFLTSGATNPDPYLFWDEFHPTVRGHEIWSQTALSTISSISESVNIL